MPPAKRTSSSAVKRAAKKAATPKKAAPRAASRTPDLESARRASQVREEETQALIEGDALPLVVVRGKKRPQARVMLGEAGKVYTVTKPKDDLYFPLVEQLADLQGLAFTELNPEDLTPEQAQRLSGALALLEQFVLCAFAKEDRPEVLAHLADPDTDEQRDDLAAAMETLMRDVWGASAASAA